MPIVLAFDLNGTLTVPSALRKQGHTAIRPGAEYLAYLVRDPRFRVVLWTSAKKHNAEAMRDRLERQVGCRFEHLLHRDHCTRTGTGFDTVKPLAKQFGGSRRMDRVLLLDDVPVKCLAEERANLVYVPPWDGLSAERGGVILATVVEELLAMPRVGADVREYTTLITARAHRALVDDADRSRSVR